MMNNCREHLCHFQPAYVSEAGPGHVDIDETKASGLGTARFTVTAPAVRIKSKDQGPLIWSLQNGKCADGAILTFGPDGPHLHIVELKGNVGHGTWRKVTKQLEGMFLTAMSVAHLLKAGNVTATTCYVVYKEDHIGTQMSAMKTRIGGSTTIGDIDSWITGEMSMPYNFKAKVKKQQKDESLIADFGTIG